MKPEDQQVLWLIPGIRLLDRAKGRTVAAVGDSMSSFVICINNKSNLASLILGKVYRTLPDAEAEARNMLRVVGEDTSEPDGYLYPASLNPEIAQIAKLVLEIGKACPHKRKRL